MWGKNLLPARLIVREILQAELERLKRQHAEREAQARAERVAATAAASVAGRAAAAAGSFPSSGTSHVKPPATAPLAAPDEGPPVMTEELLRSLKVLHRVISSRACCDTCLLYDVRSLATCHREGVPCSEEVWPQEK